jgi:TP901 family phage tail tape measure protein
VAATAIVYDIIARDGASRTLARIGEETAATGSKFGRMAGFVAKAGAVIGVAFAAAAIEGAKKAAEFQSSMVKIQTQAGGTAKDVKVLSAAVLQLGTTTQQGPQQLSEALFHLKSVGMDNIMAMKSLKVASDLAAVGGANLEDTTNALAGAWRSGIKGAGTFQQAASTVNAVIGAGNMKMEDLVGAIGTGILPAAKTFGLSLKQVGAALALMTDEGIPADAAATRLKMSFSLLGAPSHAAEKVLKSIGLTGLQLANAMRSPGGLIAAIGLLKTHLDKSKLSASQQAAVLSHAFGGGRSSSAILTMINNLGVLKQKQDQVNNSTGKYAAAVANQRKTLAAQWAILISNVQVASIRLGNAVLPPLTTFVHYIVSTVMPATGRFTHALESMIPVGKIESGFKSISKGVGDFVKGFQGPKKHKAKPLDVHLPVQFGAVASPVRIPKPVPLPISFGAVAGPAPKQLSAAQKMGEEIRKAISGGIAGINWGSLGSSLGKGLASAIGWMAKNVNSLTKQLIKALSNIDWLGVGKSVGAAAIPFVIGFVNNLLAPLFSGSFWSKHWSDVLLFVVSLIPIGKFAGLLGKVFEKVPILKALVPMLKGLDKIGGAIWKPIWAAIKAVGRGLVDGFTKVMPEAGAALERGLADLPLRLAVLGSRMIGWGERAMKGLGNGILAGFHFVGDMIGRLIGLVAKPFVRVQSQLIVHGQEIVRGLLKGIGDAAKSVGGWLKSHLVTPVINWVKNLFGIHSPSTIFASIGGNLILGLLRGVLDAAKGIGGWLRSHVINPVAKAFVNAQAWLITRGRQVVIGLFNGALLVAKTIGSWAMSHIINPFARAFVNAQAWLINRGRQTVTGLLSGAWLVAKTIGSWAYNRVIAPFARAFVNAQSWLITRGRQAVTGLLNGIWQLAKTIGSWAWNHVINPFAHAFVDAQAWLITRGRQVISGLLNGAWQLAKSIGSWAWNKVINPFAHQFVNAQSWLISHGQHIISGLLNGVINGMKGIAGWLKAHVWSPIVTGVKHLFGIHSPSTVMAEIGGNLIKGLIKGLIDNNPADFIHQIFGGVTSSAGDALSWLVKHGDVALSSLGHIASSVWSKVGGFFKNLFGGGGNGGSGVKRWSGLVLQVLGMLHQSPGWLNTVLRRMNQESGGNPNAINLTDINAQHGDPSRGLMQTIGSTFNAYAGPLRGMGIYNPLANIYAGLNYAIHRYGSLSALNRPGGYDSGGVARGTGYLPKYTVQPERVLSPRQTVAFERLVDVLDQQGGGGGATELHVYLDGSEITGRIRTQVRQATQGAAFRQRVGRAAQR